MKWSYLRRGLPATVAALGAGALAGYLAALVRPRSARDYASDYHAPDPDAVALPAGTDPAVAMAPVAGTEPGR